VAMKLSSPRRTVQGSVALQAVAVNGAWAVD
jgi:hypothetical protein